MGLFDNQLSNVIEWREFNDDTLFWKWSNSEIKRGSRLVVRPGQDAIFLYNGVVEGIFRDEGNFEVESQIIPFLSTLKGFKFGFNSGIRAEVLFINTKEILVKWGTKSPVLIPAPGLPGGMPIRSFGTFSCKVSDYDVLLQKVAGVKKQFTVDEVKQRITSELDQLLMKWISKEGKDMFNLQVNAREIAQGIESDLDMEMRSIGISITSFAISNFNYPEEIQKMAEKAAAQSMIGDMGRYQQIAMTDAMSKGGHGGNNMASDMAGMAMGMAMGQQMAQNMVAGMNQQQPQQQQYQQPPQQAPANNTGGAIPNFCPECGSKTSGSKFCGNCGTKLG